MKVCRNPSLPISQFFLDFTAFFIFIPKISHEYIQKFFFQYFWKHWSLGQVIYFVFYITYFSNTIISSYAKKKNLCLPKNKPRMPHNTLNKMAYLKVLIKRRIKAFNGKSFRIAINLLFALICSYWISVLFRTEYQLIHQILSYIINILLFYHSLTQKEVNTSFLKRKSLWERDWWVTWFKTIFL